MAPSGRALGSCVVLVCAGALTACGGDRAATATAVYTGIVTRLYGTPAQRLAAEEQAWWTAQAPAQECRRRAGVDHPARGFTPRGERRAVAPGDLAGFAPLGADFDVAYRWEQLQLAADNARLFARQVARTAEGPGRWTAQRCEAAARAVAARVPAGQQRLATAFVDELTRAQTAAAPGLPADYRRCLHAHRLAAADLPALRALVERAYPTVRWPAGTDPARLPEWRAAVAFEHRAAAVDARCRAGAVRTLTVSAAPRLATFAVQHAAELSEVSDGWARFEIDVRGLRPPD
ncbi:hypothetical protein, partial [Actinoplanes nipponensis]|uniref:hypothetical protein n=1 Tax=Actinoplanes nipponensis TaxID=135950 RepID=UPI001940C226